MLEMLLRCRENLCREGRRHGRADHRGSPRKEGASTFGGKGIVGHGAGWKVVAHASQMEKMEWNLDAIECKV